MCEQCRNNGKKIARCTLSRRQFCQRKPCSYLRPFSHHPRRIAAAVEAAGYGLVISEEEKEKQREAAATRHYKSLRNRVIVAWVFALTLMIISMSCMHTPHIEWILLVLTLPIILYSGRSFYVHAWKQLQQRTANMDTLVALSTSVAFLFSLAMTLFPQYWNSRGIETHVYYEASGMIIAFVLIGKLMEERAKRNTSSALKSLMNLQPQTALKITEDGTQEVHIASLKKGDRILVRPGEKVAVDGVVVHGESFVDESMINGEPIPAGKAQGDNVLAGTINRDGALTIEAQAVGAQTLLARLCAKCRRHKAARLRPNDWPTVSAAALYQQSLYWPALPLPAGNASTLATTYLRTVC